MAYSRAKELAAFKAKELKRVAELKDIWSRRPYNPFSPETMGDYRSRVGWENPEPPPLVPEIGPPGITGNYRGQPVRAFTDRPGSPLFNRPGMDTKLIEDDPRAKKLPKIGEYDPKTSPYKYARARAASERQTLLEHTFGPGASENKLTPEQKKFFQKNTDALYKDLLDEAKNAQSVALRRKEKTGLTNKEIYAMQDRNIEYVVWTYGGVDNLGVVKFGQMTKTEAEQVVKEARALGVSIKPVKTELVDNPGLGTGDTQMYTLANPVPTPNWRPGSVRAATAPTREANRPQPAGSGVVGEAPTVQPAKVGKRIRTGEDAQKEATRLIGEIDAGRINGKDLLSKLRASGQREVGRLIMAHMQQTRPAQLPPGRAPAAPVPVPINDPRQQQVTALRPEQPPVGQMIAGPDPTTVGQGPMLGPQEPRSDVPYDLAGFAAFMGEGGDPSAIIDPTVRAARAVGGAARAVGGAALNTIDNGAWRKPAADLGAGVFKASGVVGETAVEAATALRDKIAGEYRSAKDFYAQAMAEPEVWDAYNKDMIQARQSGAPDVPFKEWLAAKLAAAPQNVNPGPYQAPIIYQGRDSEGRLRRFPD